MSIFSDLIHDCVEVCMDDFIVYVDDFHQALEKLEKVLIHCQEVHLALSGIKCKMMQLRDCLGTSRIT